MRGRDVGYAVEGPATEEHRTCPFLETGLRGNAGLAQHLQHVALVVEDADGVITVVGAIEAVVLVNEDAVGCMEHTFTPCVQEPTLLVEDNDRMGAPVEDIDVVAGVDGDAGDLDEGPAIRQLLPSLDDLVLQLVGTLSHGLAWFSGEPLSRFSRRPRTGKVSYTPTLNAGTGDCTSLDRPIPRASATSANQSN